MAKKSIKDVNLKGKKVLIRVDFNVPLSKVDGSITDDTRIVAALPTIEHAINKGGKVILFSHLGRVESEADKAKNSCRPVAKRLSELLKKDVIFVPVTRGNELEEAINKLTNGQVLMFENTRFEDIEGKKESKNNPELGKYWASLGDVFVNDAFGTAHRAHASNAGIAANIECTSAGFLLEKEINFIGGALENPKRPFVAILGGAKVSDKIEVIKNLLKVADTVLIGGGMAFTFLKAKGLEIGKSLLEEDKVELAKELLELGKGKIVLGTDCVTAPSFADQVGTTHEFNAIPVNEMGLDIGSKTVKEFVEYINNAKTIVWNGPLGVFEFANFENGTKSVAQAIANNKNAVSIIGGGDSAAAIAKFGLEDKVSHVSTGGGASLEYLEGKVLPGVAIINEVKEDGHCCKNCNCK